MSAKKARKTRIASPPSKATRFPKTEAALRGAPPTAVADDERSRAEAAPAAAMAPEAAPVDAPAGPVAAPLAETAAVGDWAGDAGAAADLAADGAVPAEEAARTPTAEGLAEEAGLVSATALPAGPALDAPTHEPPADTAAADAALSPAPAESVAETGRPDDRVGDAAAATDGMAAGETTPASAGAVGVAETAALTAPAASEGAAAAADGVSGPTATPAATPGRRGRGRTPRAPAAGRASGEARKPSALDAAARVLAEAGRALSCPEMIAVMAAQGYWSSPAGQTPSATLYSALLREITTKGARSHFHKAGRGQFALAAAV